MSYAEMKVPELRKIISDKGITGYTKATRQMLLEKLAQIDRESIKRKASPQRRKVNPLPQPVKIDYEKEILKFLEKLANESASAEVVAEPEKKVTPKPIAAPVKKGAQTEGTIFNPKTGNYIPITSPLGARLLRLQKEAESNK